MKELLLGNPLYLLLLALISITYIFLLFHFVSHNKKTYWIFKKGCAIAFFLVLPELTISPLKDMNLGILADPVTPLRIMGVFQVALYSIYIFVISFEIRYFIKNIVTIASELLRQNPFIWALITLSVLSTAWSVTPMTSLQAAVILVIQSFFAVYFATQFDWRELSSILRWSLTLLGVVSAFYAIAKPEIGMAWKGWQGIVGHPNYLGSLMGFNAALWGLYVSPTAKNLGVTMGAILFSVYVMQMANSAGAFVVFVLLIGLLNFLRFIKSLEFRYAFTASTLFMIVATMSVIWLTENLAVIATALGKDLTFTGRTDIWPRVIHEIIAVKLFLGWGYRGFWQAWLGPDNPASFMWLKGWQIPHSHNGFLDLTVDVGLVGLALFILSFIKILIDGVTFLSSSSLKEAAMPMMILMYVVLKNVPETGLWSLGLASFLYVLIAARLGVDHSKKLGNILLHSV